MSLMGYHPLDRQRMLDRMFHEDWHSLSPYWARVPADKALHLGSALGAVENTKEKFAVNVDVSHFKPEEVKVHLNGNELTIEGNHEEKTDEHGTIQRSFVRKYILPQDTNLESLRSSLTDNGHLMIEAPKKTASTTQSRAIPITRG